MHIPSLYSNSKVVTRLICVGDHASHGVLLSEDGTTDFYPPTACAELTLLGDEMDYSNHESPGAWVHWSQLYLGEDHDRLTPEVWSGWDAIETRLDEHFGNDYPVHQAGFTNEQRADKRVAKLAGWASYHRTQVRVIYKDQGCFVILPDVGARAHARAMPGRQIVVQLGEDGARHWYAQRSGIIAYKKVYTDSFIAGQLSTYTTNVHAPVHKRTCHLCTFFHLNITPTTLAPSWYDSDDNDEEQEDVDKTF
jgi:hypothetical protein